MRKLGKKLTLLSAVMCLSAAGTALAADSGTSTQYTTSFGDVVKDSKVDVLDMEAIQKDILKIKTLDDDAADNADVNRDGVVDVTDLEAVQKQVLKISQIENIDVITTTGNVSVHDPSIVQDKDGTYYIFGSHKSWAKSTDLCNWTTFTNNINTDYEKIFADSAEWSALGGTQDSTTGKYEVSGNLWAPDVIYNTEMKKWCMYMSVNGDDWYSSIVLLTAETLDGDWTYVGPIVYSGFTNATDANAADMTDLFQVIGGSTIPDRYKQVSAHLNSLYAPNAIDPCVFYDDDGTLWMTYGSWFGGIYMLKLDAATGLRDYEHTYDLTDNESDPYQGLKLAGGTNVSGEASYIQKIGNYYYLFVTYGGLDANGGYNMRVFRSEVVTGPYLDESGNDARYMTGNTGAGSIGGTVGMRLMSYYKWSTMEVAQVAQGHNSAFVDTDGKAYLIYHTRTNDGTEGHYVKVHQLFVNEDGWLVAAPYRYSGETLNESGYSASQVAGSYEVLMQRQSVDYEHLEYVSPVTITLNSDGSVTGDYTGNWFLTENSPYITVTLGGKEYKGVVIRQIIEGTDEDTMCFTLVGTKDEMAVWGSKYLTGKRGVEMAMDKLTVASTALDDMTLPTTGAQNVQISWKSSNPEIIATDGTLTLPEEDTVVTLTATFTSNGVSESKTYKVQVYEAPANDTDPYVIAKYFTDKKVDLSSAKEGSYQVPNPFNSANTSGLEIYNGAAIEFEVEHPSTTVTMLNTLLAFTGTSGKLYFTEGSYLGYNNNTSTDNTLWYDANIENYALVKDYIGTKAKVRIDFLPTGYEVSVNGSVVYTNATVDAGTTKGTNKLTNYSNVLTWLNETATTLNFGWGSWWTGSYQGTISNVVCYAYPVEKVDTSQYVYYQDYKKGNISEWKSTDGASYLKVANDGGSYGNYFKFAPASSENSRGAICEFADEGKVSGQYTLDFDLQLTAGNNQQTEFAITTNNRAYQLDSSNKQNINWGIASGYLVKLSTTNSETWTINDGTATVKIPKGTWVHFTVDADTDAGTAVVKITNGDTELYNGTITMQDKGTLQGFYVLGGRYSSITCVDNVAIKTAASVAAASAEKTTTGSSGVSSSSSMNLKYSFADENGNAYYTSDGKPACFVASGSTASGAITIPSEVTVGTTTYQVVAIGENAFLNQTGLTGITLPNTIQTIDETAFMYCSSLTSITLPESVTSVGPRAFYYCTGLTEVTICSANANIYNTAFDCCSALQTVHATGNAKTCMENQDGFNATDETKLTYTVVD